MKLITEQLPQIRIEVNKYSDFPLSNHSTSNGLSTRECRKGESCEHLDWRNLEILKHVIFMNCLGIEYVLVCVNLQLLLGILQ